MWRRLERVTWEQFERATKYLGAMGWATWEIVAGPGRPQVLAFIGTVLASSEVLRARAKAKAE